MELGMRMGDGQVNLLTPNVIEICFYDKTNFLPFEHKFHLEIKGVFNLVGVVIVQVGFEN